MGDLAFPAFSLAKILRKAPQMIAADVAEKWMQLALKNRSCRSIHQLLP